MDLSLLFGKKAVKKTRKKRTRKSQPTSSQVHVPATGEPDKILRKKKEHNKQNIDALREAFNQFLNEEEIEGDSHDAVIGKFHKWIGKDSLDANARDHIAGSNFALPDQRKYPIHDIEHARNALARSSGKSEESKVRSAVYAKYPSLKKAIGKDFPAEEEPQKLGPADTEPKSPNDPPDPNTSDEMYPEFSNLEAKIIKEAFGDLDDDDSDDLSNLLDAQKLVQGMDYEMMSCTEDPEIAKAVAQSNLENDEDYYSNLLDLEKSKDDPLAMPESSTIPTGLNLDLGSGNCREDGYLGMDIYPYDYGTFVHDFDLGLPFEDQSVSKLRVGHALEESADPKALLSEIQRVLMPEGQFVYEGPNDIWNYPDWAQDYPGLVLTDHEDNDTDDGEISKGQDGNNIYRQTFTRVAQPDPATANDAEPRIGIPQFDNLPADALLAIGAMDYYSSDASSSGPGNRIHGYPSQGALSSGVSKAKAKAKKPQRTKPAKAKVVNNPKEMGDATDELKEDVKEKISGKSKDTTTNDKAPLPGESTNAIIFGDQGSNVSVRISKADPEKQIVYGVVLAPNEVDSQEDWMSPEDIEEAAHNYIKDYRVVGKEHEEAIEDAYPVESYIAPQDFEMTGQYGPQVIKKGSWILGVKVNDPDEWRKIKDGTYSGFSVGGLGLRDESNMGLQDEDDSDNIDTSENPI